MQRTRDPLITGEVIMTKFRVVFLLIAVLLASLMLVGCASDDDDSNGTPGLNDYFPNKIGARFNYDIFEDELGGMGTETMYIAGKTTYQGTEVYIIEMTINVDVPFYPHTQASTVEITGKTYMSVSSDGVFTHYEEMAFDMYGMKNKVISTYDPPYKALDSESRMQVGHSWEQDYTEHFQMYLNDVLYEDYYTDYHSKAEVISSENKTVTAGTFNCLVVRFTDSEIGEDDWTHYQYISPGIGIVYGEEEETGGFMELTSYSGL